MIFKKGTYIVTDKDKTYSSAVAVLLRDDFNPHTDKWIPYVNWFTVSYKPRTKNVVNFVQAAYEENNGGTISFDLSGNWHYAGKNIISHYNELINKFDSETK